MGAVAAACVRCDVRPREVVLLFAAVAVVVRSASAALVLEVGRRCVVRWCRGVFVGAWSACLAVAVAVAVVDGSVSEEEPGVVGREGAADDVENVGRRRDVRLGEGGRGVGGRL